MAVRISKTTAIMSESCCGELWECPNTRAVRIKTHCGPAAPAWGARQLSGALFSCMFVDPVSMREVGYGTMRRVEHALTKGRAAAHNSTCTHKLRRRGVGTGQRRSRRGNDPVRVTVLPPQLH